MASADEPKTGPIAATEPATSGTVPRSPKTETPEVNDKQTSVSPASSASEASSTGSDTPEPQASDGTHSTNQAAPSSNSPKNTTSSAPPLPTEPIPGTSASSAPPLPSEPVPSQAPAEPAPAEPEDDGWEYHWNASTSSYWFYNRFTQVWQENNPRLPPHGTAAAASSTIPTSRVPAQPAAGGHQPISDPTSVAGGYNPAIHGDYDPNAWYAQAARAVEEEELVGGGQPASAEMTMLADPSAVAGTAGFFNRHTGAWQRPDQGPERHGDEARSRRQLNNFFDVDAAANEHDGRSLRAERSGRKPTKAELKAYKEKRKARKEERRRAWLRD